MFHVIRLVLCRQTPSERHVKTIVNCVTSTTEMDRRHECCILHSAVKTITGRSNNIYTVITANLFIWIQELSRSNVEIWLYEILWFEPNQHQAYTTQPNNPTIINVR